MCLEPSQIGDSERAFQNSVCSKLSVDLYIVSLYLYLYICIFISVSLYLYLYICIFISVSLYLYLYICIFISVSLYLYLYIYIHIEGTASNEAPRFGSFTLIIRDRVFRLITYRYT
jgi:hypothetical protein